MLVDVNENRLPEARVEVVNDDVFVPIARARLADGAVSEDQAVAVDPEHAANVGVPPAVETKQSVPAPPVAVSATTPLALVYSIPFAEVHAPLPPHPVIVKLDPPTIKASSVLRVEAAER